MVCRQAKPVKAVDAGRTLFDKHFLLVPSATVRKGALGNANPEKRYTQFALVLLEEAKQLHLRFRCEQRKSMQQISKLLGILFESFEQA